MQQNGTQDDEMTSLRKLSRRERCLRLSCDGIYAQSNEDVCGNKLSDIWFLGFLVCFKGMLREKSIFHRYGVSRWALVRVFAEADDVAGCFLSRASSLVGTNDTSRGYKVTSSIKRF